MCHPEEEMQSNLDMAPGFVLTALLLAQRKLGVPFWARATFIQVLHEG